MVQNSICVQRSCDTWLLSYRVLAFSAAHWSQTHWTIQPYFSTFIFHPPSNVHFVTFWLMTPYIRASGYQCLLFIICTNIHRGADKSLARPGRKKDNVSIRMAWISFGALSCKKKNLMRSRVSMLLKSRASLTCFRACFLPGRTKNLSAPGIYIYIYLFI